MRCIYCSCSKRRQESVMIEPLEADYAQILVGKPRKKICRIHSAKTEIDN